MLCCTIPYAGTATVTEYMARSPIADTFTVCGTFSAFTMPKFVRKPVSWRKPREAEVSATSRLKTSTGGNSCETVPSEPGCFV